MLDQQLRRFLVVWCRVPPAVPSADRRPHTRLLHPQLHHHADEEQPAPGEQRKSPWGGRGLNGGRGLLWEGRGLRLSCAGLQVRDLAVAYLLVGLTYLYVGVLIFAAFPSPPLSKECIEPVRRTHTHTHSRG